jgi:enoyl-[acyl-carrier protein] reductase II
MLKTALCRQLGIEHPIFFVGFAAGAGPELAAVVANAGACGVVGGSSDLPPDLRKKIRILRGMTDEPFGVNVIPAIATKA